MFAKELSHYDYEHVFCDNASSDNTVKILKELAAADPHVKVIVNARNFGPFRSMFNGSDAGVGRCRRAVPAGRSARSAGSDPAIRQALGGRLRGRLRHPRRTARKVG